MNKKMKLKTSVFIYFIVIFISILVLWQQYSNRIDSRLDYYHAEIRQTLLHINSINRLSLSQVKLIQTAAQSYFRQLSVSHSPLFEMLHHDPKRDIFVLDKVTAPYTTANIGNLTGVGDHLKRTERAKEVIHMALSLNAVLFQAKQNVPQSTWTYFLAKDHFVNILPWAPSETFNLAMDLSLYQADAYTLSMPENNSNRNIYLTKIYIDYAGKGLMVTIGAPVYRKDDHLGMVGLDLTISTLSDILRDLNIENLNSVIFNEQGQVIAHPSAISPEDKEPRKIAEVLSKNLKGELKPILNLSAAQFQRMAGYRILRMDLEGVPWQFLAYISETALTKAVLFELVPFGGTLLFFLITIYLFLKTWNANQKAKAEIEQRRQTEINLVRARKEAEQANRAKSLFLAKMSHDLRTPLNSIMGYSRLIQRDPQVSKEQKKYLDVIKQSSETLLGLINEVLEIAKIESGQLVLRTDVMDLYKLLHDLQSIFNQRASLKKLDLSFDWNNELPRFIRIDTAKLRDVLINLLDNAIKFTHSGGIVFHARPDDNTLYFEVADSGTGIEPKYLDIIFQPFARGVTSSDAAPGSGLGLTISSEYIRLMGGTLKVNSTPGKGSVFSFSIKFETADESDLPLKKPDTKVVKIADPKQELRVLVVDDVETNRNFLVKMLTDVGFPVKEGKNGQEALEINDSWSPHLILMDIRMPGMDGREAIKRLRSTKKGADIKIIAVTASAFQDDLNDFIAQGADDAITKPFMESELFEKIGKLLDIEFIREEIDSDEVSLELPEVTQKELSRLPAEFLDDLFAAIEMGDQDGAIQLLESQRKEFPALTQKVILLVTEFESEKLMRLIEAVKDSSKLAKEE